ncbi:MAG: hypothetical protein CO099_10180 [Bdellovibrio sp. CG_4_9_14_3_um_filter_39_7]|nr:MAG: hypothetical protein CO099_10180 [Bdellovibrio sp. CG_4_9_14_3_um_filter_39_7]
MTKEYKDALLQVEQEQKDKQLEELKGYFRKTLEAIENKKAEKERIEEELRVLKLDLEDLKEGKFKKIEERQNEAPTAKRVSVIHFERTFWPQPHPSQFPWWNDWYGGTWTVNSTSGRKTFYF